MNEYEVFPRGKHIQSSRGSEIQIRCGPQRITFSKAAAEYLKYYARVFLLRSTDRQKAGVRPTEDEAGFLITRNKSNHQSYITCRAFLKATGLANQGVFPASWNESESCLEWDIPSSACQLKAQEENR